MHPCSRQVLLPLSILWRKLETLIQVGVSLLTSIQSRLMLTVKSAFLTKWRGVTSFLLRGAPSTQDAQLRTNVSRAVAEIDQQIGPFASPQFPPQERVAGLEGIVQRGTQMASTLFSQPTTWKFNWGSSGSPNNVTVFPGLQKLTDANGKPLASPITVEAPKTVDI
jgi:hypothetical protein